jgi:hypothetical protein
MGNRMVSQIVGRDHQSLNCSENKVKLSLLSTPEPLVRQETIPTERPPLVDKVSANFSG